MEKTLIQQTSQLIARDFELEINDETLTESELFERVANEVAYLLEHRLEFLFNQLYRLDVKEQYIREALAPDAEKPANILIAQRIIDRQKQRIFTKQKYKQPKPEELDGLEF